MWESTSKLSRLVIHSSVRLGIKNKRRRRYEAIPLQIESTWDEKWGTKLWNLTDLTSYLSDPSWNLKETKWCLMYMNSIAKVGTIYIDWNIIIARKQLGLLDKWARIIISHKSRRNLNQNDFSWNFVSHIANNENRFSSSNWRSPIWRSVG